MPDLKSLYEIKGVVQPYSWGGQKFIPELLGVPNPVSRPQAEYWLGAHPNSPSQVVQGDHTSPLDKLISLHPNEFLGEMVYQQFGRLPYLLKILDVKDMLSIQAHPSKSAAEKGFLTEEQRGLPLQAANRNYKDDNHKPELMFALSEFWLLHGFKSPDLLKSTLLNVPELQFLLPVWEKGGYRALYEKVMLLPQEEVQRILSPLFARLLPAYDAGQLKKEAPDFWAARAYQAFCKEGILDRGIFSIYLLNLVKLKPGQAVYQDVGILHAYLEGQNVELMANSDNVLRGGLTNKYVDVNELMKQVCFEPVQPRIIDPVSDLMQQASIYPTTAADFELQHFRLSAEHTLRIKGRTTDIYFILEGNVEIQDADTLLRLHKGQSFLSTAQAHLRILAHTDCQLFRATVPVAGSQ